MTMISMTEALRQSLTEAMKNNNDVYIMGEDIGAYGGAFKVTAGMLDEFGPERIVNTPISEASVVGVALGSALGGMRPVVEIMFMDFMALAFDQIINVAAKWRAVYGDEFCLPIVIRAAAGAGRSYGPTHSQSFEGLLMNVPGLKIVCPANAKDAAGLLKASIEDNDPVIFIEHKAIYARKCDVPETIESIPLGKGQIIRPGEDISLVTYGRHVQETLKAAMLLEEKGFSAEIIDLRTIKPLDTEIIIDSVRRTGKIITIEESPVIGGVGAEIGALIAAEAFDYLEAPFRKLGAAERPIACAPDKEAACFADAAKIAETAEELCHYG